MYIYICPNNPSLIDKNNIEFFIFNDTPVIYITDLNYKETKQWIDNL